MTGRSNHHHQPELIQRSQATACLLPWSVPRSTRMELLLLDVRDPVLSSHFLSFSRLSKNVTPTTTEVWLPVTLGNLRKLDEIGRVAWSLKLTWGHLPGCGVGLWWSFRLHYQGRSNQIVEMSRTNKKERSFETIKLQQWNSSWSSACSRLENQECKGCEMFGNEACVSFR